jgi:methylamine dehydrogenase heavy chain
MKTQPQLKRLLAQLLGGALIAFAYWATSSSAVAQSAQAQPPEIPAETLGTSSLKDATKERVYVADVAFPHISDGRIRVFNARTGATLGMLNTGFLSNFTLSADSSEIYVATTYLSRGGRGDRVDVLEVWDSTTLDLKYEVVLPPKRSQSLNYRGMVTVTGNGRFLLVQNATPATSITVVDLQERKVVSEVPTPGCWGTLPSSSQQARFAMLCGDGTIATVTLGATGEVTDRQVSPKVFDADKDAWFISGDHIGDTYYFVSFAGVLSAVDVGGATASVKSSVPLVAGNDVKLGWRPGGLQVLTVHPSGKWAVLTMHNHGAEGTHKWPAKQLWIVDVNTGKRVATVPGGNAVSLAFSHSGKRLQALDGVTGALRVWDWLGDGKLRLVTTVASTGDSPLQIESHD